MKYENTEVIHLRIPTVLAQFINRASFQTGISKQEIIRQIVRKHFSDSQGYDIVLEHHKKTIEQNTK